MNHLKCTTRIYPSITLVLAVGLLCLVAGLPALAQPIYQPGFREQQPDSTYSARSVELNYWFNPWAVPIEQESLNDRLSVRISQLGTGTSLAAYAYDSAAVHKISNEELAGEVPSSGTELFIGARMVDSSDRLQPYSNVSPLLGNTKLDSSIETILFGPHAGVSSTYRVDNFTFNSRISSLLAYHAGSYQQSTSFGNWLAPGGVNAPLYLSAKTQVAEPLVFTTEWHVAANYWFGRNTRLNLTWTNTYFSSIVKLSTQPLYIDYVLYDGNRAISHRNQVPSQDTWIDSLQLSLIITR